MNTDIDKQKELEKMKRIFVGIHNQGNKVGDYSPDGISKNIDRIILKAQEIERERIFVELQSLADLHDCDIEDGFIESNKIYEFINNLNTNSDE